MKKKKRLNEGVGLRFIMHQINPCEPAIIIYNSEKKNQEPVVDFTENGP